MDRAAPNKPPRAASTIGPIPRPVSYPISVGTVSR